jgi:hypothetical protein
MTFRAALIASAFLLAACPQAQQAAPAEETPSEEPAGSSTGFSDGSLTVSLNGGAPVTLTANECWILNDGANGVVRGGDGSYELGWSDTGFRFIWDTGQGIFNGDVTGSVSGDTVSFEGANNGMSVQGSAACD